MSLLKWMGVGSSASSSANANAQSAASAKAPLGAEFKRFGLENFGNTCYANSVLQSLYFCQPFRELVCNSPDPSYPPPLPVLATPSPPQPPPPQPPLTTKTASKGGHKRRPSATDVRAPADSANPTASNPGTTSGRSASNANATSSTSQSQAQAPHPQAPPIPTTPPSLFSALRSLFIHIAHHPLDKGTVSPSAFVTKVRKENESFRSAMHQDAHEFMNYLLNKIVEDLEHEQHNGGRDKTPTSAAGNGNANPNPNTSRDDLSKSITSLGYPPSSTSSGSSSTPSSSTSSSSSSGTSSHSPAKTFVHALFEGSLTSETRCLTCETVSSRDESFLDLSIDIEQNSSVTACLRQFSASEMLCQRNKFFCDSCCGLQEAEKRMKIKKLPNILALHLKRFKFQEDVGKYIKLAYRVAFPLELRLFNTVDDAEDPDRLYELFAIVVHIGGGPYHGHYIAIVRSRGSWLVFDDDTVESIKEADIPKYFGDAGSGAGYVLFYQAVDLDRKELGLPAVEAASASVSNPAGLAIPVPGPGPGSIPASSSPHAPVPAPAVLVPNGHAIHDPHPLPIPLSPSDATVFSGSSSTPASPSTPLTHTTRLPLPVPPLPTVPASPSSNGAPQTPREGKATAVGNGRLEKLDTSAIPLPMPPPIPAVMLERGSMDRASSPGGARSPGGVLGASAQHVGASAGASGNPNLGASTSSNAGGGGGGFFTLGKSLKHSQSSVKDWLAFGERDKEKEKEGNAQNGDAHSHSHGFGVLSSWGKEKEKDDKERERDGERENRKDKEKEGKEKDKEGKKKDKDEEKDKDKDGKDKEKSGGWFSARKSIRRSREAREAASATSTTTSVGSYHSRAHTTHTSSARYSSEPLDDSPLIPSSSPVPRQYASYDTTLAPSNSNSNSGATPSNANSNLNSNPAGKRPSTSASASTSTSTSASTHATFSTSVAAPSASEYGAVPRPAEYRDRDRERERVRDRDAGNGNAVEAGNRDRTRKPSSPSSSSPSTSTKGPVHRPSVEMVLGQVDQSQNQNAVGSNATTRTGTPAHSYPNSRAQSPHVLQQSEAHPNVSVSFPSLTPSSTTTTTTGMTSSGSSTSRIGFAMSMTPSTSAATTASGMTHAEGVSSPNAANGSPASVPSRERKWSGKTKIQKIVANAVRNAEKEREEREKVKEMFVNGFASGFGPGNGGDVGAQPRRGGDDGAGAGGANANGHATTGKLHKSPGRKMSLSGGLKAFARKDKEKEKEPETPPPVPPKKHSRTATTPWDSQRFVY